MREFKELFEELGYTFQSADVLEDVYLFYKYYNNQANKGVSAILLEGDPGCGKTFLSEVFSHPSFTVTYLKKIKFAYILYSFFYVKFLLFIPCVILCNVI